MEKLYPLKLSHICKTPIWSGSRLISEWAKTSPSDVLGEIKKIPGVKKYMKVRELGEKSAVYSVEYGNEFDIRREVFSAMARINAPILEMKSGNESLEDMFLKLTQGAGKAGR